MARLIPSFMDDHTPPGERDVFNLLAAGPDDWVALHSLDLAPWNRGLRTEIDFVIIIPDAGIICIEVKSQENIAFDTHRWYPQTITRSPFKQAADGRHTFYRRLSEIAPKLRRVPVVHCCIFPQAPFDLTPNLSVQPWELMDSRVFRSFSSSDVFCADLKVRVEQSVVADGKLTRLDQRLSHGQIDTIVKSCVPVQKFHPDARYEIARREEDIERILRQQQKPVLQLAAWNERLIVSGGAGTGKTLIAMEVARRAAEQGRRVGLLCYNQLVGDWMKQRIEQTNPVLPNLLAGRAIRVVSEMAGVEIPGNPSQDFWEKELPQIIEERLTDPDFKACAVFDFLVLDEAQDLLARPWLWESITQFFSGGMSKGAYAIFGDFDNQVLTAREPMHDALRALDATSRPVRWELSENCRNYRIIGETAVQLAGHRSSTYSGYLRIGGSVYNYDIFFYENEAAQLDKLGQFLKEFKAQGYKPSEITLLSFRADHLSAAVRLKFAGYKIRPAWQNCELTTYASVHAFKGMENKIIILTDVVLDDLGFRRDLFYTGMTRATESVRILCDKNSQETLFQWLSRKGDS
ncbi:MAG: NERD domain-containing protein [Nitrospirales bacterium]|nr:NERD domain-containing protein [Nitrospirales bacterium]